MLLCIQMLNIRYNYYEYSSLYLPHVCYTVFLYHYYYTTGRLQNYKDTLLEKRSTMTKANSTYKQNILKLSQKLNKIRANLIEKRNEYAKLSTDPDQEVNNMNSSSGGSPAKALPITSSASVEQSSSGSAVVSSVEPTATIAAPATQSSTSVNSNSSTTSNTTSSNNNNTKSKLYALSVAVGSVLETSLNVTSSHTTSSYTTSFTTSQERKNRLESRINELEEQESELVIQLESIQIEYNTHINNEQNDCIYIIQSSSRHLTEELIQVNAMMNKVRTAIECNVYVYTIFKLYSVMYML